jgi:hypothetical protein
LPTTVAISSAHVATFRWVLIALLGLSGLSAALTAQAYPCTRPPCEPRGPSEGFDACSEKAEWIVEGELVSTPVAGTQIVCDHGQCADVYKPPPLDLTNSKLLKGTYPVTDTGRSTVTGASHCFPVTPRGQKFVAGKRYRFYGSQEVLGNYATPGFFAVEVR